VGPNPANGFEQRVTATTPGGRLQFPNFKHTYHGISGSLGFTYNVSERVLLKANIARGYRAPNITEIGSNGLDPGRTLFTWVTALLNPSLACRKTLAL
jgi:iron complex outermembrane receptor protein